MDFIKDNDELTIDPSAVRVKSHADVTTDRDRIVTTIDSSNITVIQREVRNTVDTDTIDVSAAHFHIGMEGIDISNARFSTQYDISSITIRQTNTEGILSGNDDVSAGHVRIDLSGIDISTKPGVVTTLKDGKIGIGTNAPQSNLDVKGNAKFYTNSMLLSEFQTDAGVQKFADIVFEINQQASYQPAQGNLRIYISTNLTNLYNETYGTTGQLPGVFDDAGSYFYSTWTDGPTQEVLDNILKIVPSVTFDGGDVRIDGKVLCTESTPVHIVGPASWSKVFKINDGNDGLYMKLKTQSTEPETRCIFGCNIYDDGYHTDVDNILSIVGYSNQRPRVGIGTNTPDSQLHIFAPIQSDYYIGSKTFADMDVGTLLHLDAQSPGESTFSAIKFSSNIYNESVASAYIAHHWADPDRPSGSLSFILNQTSVMHLKGNGNVGIGTETPTSPLYVNSHNPSQGTYTYHPLIRMGGTSFGGNTGYANFTGSFGWYRAGQYAGGYVYLSNNGSAEGSGQGIFLCGTAGYSSWIENGRFGIGTTSPDWPLHITGYQWYGQSESDMFPIATGPYLRFNDGTLGGTGGIFGDNTGDAISIYSAKTIFSESYIAASDNRIKTEICEYSNASGLDLVNQIECKEYHYTDPLRRRNDKTIGYIAQQVREIFPNAVGINIDVVPDELRVIENVEWTMLEDKYSLTISDLDLSSNNTGKCRFYVSNDLSGNDEVMKDIKVEPDKKTFVFDESWNNVFFYGKEVNDFHTIDKQKIFQLHHPAIQELSRLNDEKTAQIAALQQDNADLRAQLQQIKTHLGLS